MYSVFHSGHLHYVKRLTYRYTFLHAITIAPSSSLQLTHIAQYLCTIYPFQCGYYPAAREIYAIWYVNIQIPAQKRILFMSKEIRCRILEEAYSHAYRDHRGGKNPRKTVNGALTTHKLHSSRRSPWYIWYPIRCTLSVDLQASYIVEAFMLRRV